MPEFNDYPPPFDPTADDGGYTSGVPYEHSAEALETDADMLSDSRDATGDEYSDEFDETADTQDVPNDHVSRFTTEPRPDIPPLEGRPPQPDAQTQCHAIREKILTGDHPDKYIAQHIGELITHRTEQQDRLTEALATLPNQNDAHRETLEQLAEISHDDYGIDPPITILTREQMAAVAERLSEPELLEVEGQVKYGHILIAVEKRPLETFGESYLTAVGMHELGHAVNPAIYAVETRRFDPYGIGAQRAQNVVRGQWGRRYQIGAKEISGLVQPNDIFTRNPRLSGLFWDEGRVDARRVRAQEERGIAVQGPLTREQGTHITPITTVTMTAEGIGTPRLSQDTHEVAIPWKYTFGLKTDTAGKPAWMYLPAAGLAAYAIDLLEQHALSGLTYNMDLAAATQDPARKESIRDQINEIHRGLYDLLADYNHNTENFAYALRRVIYALDIADEPV